MMSTQILQVMLISGDRPFVEPGYLNKCSIPKTLGSGNVPLVPVTFADLAEMFIVKIQMRNIIVRSSLTFKL